MTLGKFTGDIHKMTDHRMDTTSPVNGQKPPLGVGEDGDKSTEVFMDDTNVDKSDENLIKSKFDDSLLSGSHALPGDALLGRITKKKENGHHDTVVTVDTGDKTLHKDSAHSKCWRGVYSWLKKNEYLVLILGSVMFLIGCVALAVGVYVMYTGETCQHQSSTTIVTRLNVTSPVQSTLTDQPPDVDDHPPYTNTTDSPYNITSQLPVTNATEAVPRGENLALGHPAYQSSTLVEGGTPYDASLATDGSSQYSFYTGSCSRTAMETRPYWYVDLGSLEVVKTVKLFIPRDVPGELHNFEVRIGQDEDISVNPLCRYYMGTALTSRVTIRCERPMYGRYVSIELLGDVTRPMNRLTLCEVQVYNH